MKLFWNTNKNLNTFWGNYHANNSKEWIFTILKKLNITEIDNLETILNNEKIIIVDSELSNKNDFYKNLLNKTKNIFLIHLGDEGGTETKNYIYNNCLHIWRPFCLGEFFNLDKRLIGKHFTQYAYDQKFPVKSTTLYESVFTILPAPKCKHHTPMSSNEFDKLMTEEYVFVPQNKTEYAQDATTASCGKIIIIQYKNTPTRQARVNELIDIIVKFVDSMQHQLLDKNIKEYHDQGNTMFWIFIKTCDDMRKEQFGLDNLMSHELLKDFTHLKDRIIILDKDSIQRCLPPVCRGHAMFIEQFIKNKSWRQHSLTEIKGIGPKTAAKYEQIGVKTIDDLLELKVQQNLRSKFKGENGFGFSNQTIKRHQQLAQEYGKLFEQRFKQ